MLQRTHRARNLWFSDSRVLVVFDPPGQSDGPGVPLHCAQQSHRSVQWSYLLTWPHCPNAKVHNTQFIWSLSHTLGLFLTPKPNADSVWSTPLNCSCTQAKLKAGQNVLHSHFSASKPSAPLRNRALPFSHSLSTHT